MSPDHDRSHQTFSQLSESQIDSGLARLLEATVSHRGTGGNVIILPAT